MTSKLAALLSSALCLFAPSTASAEDAGPSKHPACAAGDPSSPLVLDGMTAPSAELRARLRPWLEPRSAQLLDIAPDGRSILISTRFGQTAELHLVGAPLGARTQVTFAEEPITSASFVPGHAGEIIYAMDRGGDESYQLYRLDLERRETTRLTDGKSRNIELVSDRDGHHLVFASNARNGRDMDLWITNGKKAEDRELLLEREGHWVPVEIAPDGRRVLMRHVVSIAESSLHIFDLASRKLSPLTPEAPKAAHRNAVFSTTGDRLYLTSDRDGDLIRLFEVDLKTGRFTLISREIAWDVEELARSPDGKSLAFTTNEGGSSVLNILDTSTRISRPVKALPRGVISSLRFAKRARVLAFTLSTPTHPADVYTFELGTKRVVRWTESEVGGLDPRRFVEPEVIEYPTFDGRKIPAFSYVPQGSGPFPVLIDIHGGPEAQARPAFSSMIQLLASSLGVAVFVPNVRGSDGYGKAYLALDNGVLRMDAVKDIGALLDFIERDPRLDPTRVAVHGGSYGGFMVLASLVEYGSRLRAGIDVVGISNMVTFLERTSEYRRDLRRVEYGDERDPAIRAFLESIAPTRNAHRISSELFVAQGANDPRVPASEAEQIVRAVRARGRTVWSLLAQNEGHGFKQKENRDVYLMLLTAFLEQHLIPASRP